MLVKMLVSAVGPDIGAPSPDEVIDVPEAVASVLVRDGLAEPVEAKKPTKRKPETAAMTAVPETR